MNQFEQTLLASTRLATLPSVAQRLLDLSSEPEANAERLTDAIEADECLPDRIVRLVNSAMYGMSREIETLREAIAYLGLDTVRSVALSLSFVAAVRPARAEPLLDSLWCTSLMKALAARRLASSSGDWQPAEAFLAGLVSYAGALVLFESAAGYPELVDRFYRGEGDLVELERASLATDHVALGALMLEHWNFPRRMVAPLRQQHGLLDARGDTARRGQILAAAERLARVFTVAGSAELVVDLNQALSEAVGISESSASVIAEELPQELRETAGVFDIPCRLQPGYKELLQEARGRLAARAARADRARALGASKETSRGFDGLPAMESLEHDEETGVLGAEPFQQVLEAVHRRARQLRRPLSLLVVRVRELKGLEALQGSPFAEAMGTVAGRIGTCVRRSDPKARIARDQLAVLAPGCLGTDAPGVAERLRFAVEHAPIETASGPLVIELEIGIAATTPHHDASTPFALMNAARAATEAAGACSERIALAS